MKGLMLRKIALAAFLLVISNNMSKIECSELFTNKRQTEDEIITQAVNKFKHKIQNVDGHLRSISCRFKVHEGKSLETITKTYFNDYRKKPDYEIEKHFAAADLQPDSVIEVIYVKHCQSLSVVHKDARGKKRLSTKQVDLPIGFSA